MIQDMYPNPNRYFGVVGSVGLMEKEDRVIHAHGGYHISGIDLKESITRFPSRYKTVLKGFGRLLRKYDDAGVSRGDADLTKFLEDDENLAIHYDKTIKFKDSEKETCVSYDIVSALGSIKCTWKSIKIGTEDSSISAFKEGYC